MHVVLRARRRMPTPRPNTLVIDGKTYRFRAWSGQTMRFHAADGGVACVRTKKLSDLRFVKSIVVEGVDRKRDSIDAYRVD